MGGNHRFRLSDMMPNAWFYKLKDMNQPQRNNPTTKKKTTSTKSPPPQNNHNHHHHHHHQQPPLIPNRASYYFPSNSPVHPKAFDTHFPALDSPRKSPTPHKPPRTRIPAIANAITSSSSLSLSSSSSSCRGSVSDSDSDHSYRITNNDDIVLDIVGSELELRPILTKPIIKKSHAATEQCPKPATKKASSPPEVRRVVRMRTTTTSAKKKKVRVARKRRSSGLSESFAVVKSSSDPKTDFRESMAEMIAENGLGSPKELEELLACYLSLNSDHYHRVIVEVFQEIWFQITSNN